MTSFKNHNVTVCCLTALVCLFLTSFFGCKDKEPTPPAKPSVIKKRIEPDKSKTVVLEKETKEVPASSQTPPSGMEKSAMVSEKTEPALVQPSDEAMVADKASADQVKPQKGAPETLDGVQPPTEPPQKEQLISLKGSIPDDSWRYDPKGKVDPFAPLFKEDGDTRQKKKGKLTRPLTPLEKIDLSQLKLVAIIRTETSSRAMVEDAAGKGYVLSIGTRIGTHSGKVVNIGKERVSIEEEFEDFLGRTKKTERELRLQKPSGEE